LTYTKVGVIEDFPEGELRAFTVDGVRLFVVHCDGGFHALSNVCTHVGFMIAPGTASEGTVACPVHGAIFGLQKGEPLQGPATDALTVYDVRLDGGNILVAT
jgi:3-phenylpropionate/trans-cinnamate dioxygenase ferredoxin subunit